MLGALRHLPVRSQIMEDVALVGGENSTAPQVQRELPGLSSIDGTVCVGGVGWGGRVHSDAALA